MTIGMKLRLLVKIGADGQCIYLRKAEFEDGDDEKCSPEERENIECDLVWS